MNSTANTPRPGSDPMLQAPCGKAAGALPLAELGVGWTLVISLAWAAGTHLALPLSYTILAAGLYGLVAALLCLGWLRYNPRVPADFGWANRITLARAVVIILIAALVPFPAVLGEHGWALAWLSLGALILDGADGSVARITGSSSAFGSRFDMELDAFFILALALMIVSMDKAGTWVLSLGLIRYGFVMATSVWPWLQQPLPESFRRKTVCVWQVATLLVCLIPTVSVGFASTALALALVLLVYSFAVDLRWLARQRMSTHPITGR